MIMVRPIIDDEHRTKREAFLKQYNLDGGHPDTRKLMDVTEEFGPQPFTMSDLYNLYLVDFVKTLPEEYQKSLRIDSGVLRSIAQAHAAAAAHVNMMMYLMLKWEEF